MEFTTILPLTGIVQRTSKKTGNDYLIVNFLNAKGESFGAMYKGSDEILGLYEMFDRVKATFEVITGRYMALNLINIEPLD